MSRKPKQSQRRSATRSFTLPGSPFLTRIGLHEDRVTPGVHPFTLPLIENGLDITLSAPVTFLVGENGSGKSTLLEALAWALGYSAQGGARSESYAEGVDGHALGRALALSWRQRVTDGFFLRAETFFNFASYLEEVGSDFRAYGGRPLHAQSHGEAFLALFQNRFEDGVYILDEPEAALSPARQLAFLRVIHQLTVTKCAQLIIATHSPILLTFPGATVLLLEDGQIRSVGYRDTEHYQLTRGFLEAPERFYRFLLEDDDATEEK
jgi:predicted ATPase